MRGRLHAVISGRVQGVAFRYAACRQARALGVTGWVRNLYDGRVEALFEGSQDSLEKMRDWCRQGPPLAHVTNVEETWQDVEPTCDGFHIVE